jgi:hypothetical protein
MRPMLINKICVKTTLSLLLAISPLVFAEVPFDHVILDREGPKDPWAKITGDIDGDGFADVVIGGRQGPLVWYAYPTWSKGVIAESGYRTVDGEVGDVDGDGDLDVVMGGLIWYENPRPGGEPAKNVWRAHKVADHPTHDVELADLDGDGDLDIVTRDQSEFGHKAGNKIYLWRQNEDATWTQKVIDCPHGESITLGDIDKDGDPDIVIGGIWFENTRDIVNGVWNAHRFGNWHPNATVQIADINGDSLPDVVLSPSELKGQSYKMSWFEAPSDPKKDNWTEHIIAEPIECVIHGLVTADINGDGMVDVVSSEMHQGADPDEVAVFVNQANGSAWTKQVISSRGSHFIRAADIGNDGDIDIIGANWSGPYQPIEMWENKSGGWVHLSTRKGDLPFADVGRQAASLILDIDKDGVNDFVIAGWSEQTSMVWFRNTGAGWQRYLIDNRKSHIEAGGAYCDIDGDGDPDILQGGSWATNEVWWWENPYPVFDPEVPWQRHTIKNSGDKQHHDQIFADFDGDGANELVFWNQQARKLWMSDIPTEPREKENWNFTEIWSWPQEFKYEGFAAADIDLDGTIDLIGGGMWFKHLGNRKFQVNIIDDKYGSSRSAADDLIKGGRPEVVLGSGDTAGPLNLYRFVDGTWHKTTLIEVVDHGHSLQIADVDGDGNLDIFTAEMVHWHNGENPDAKLWILYGNGQGDFRITEIQAAEGLGNHESKLGDLDGDGDLDILQKPFELDDPQENIDIWLNNGTARISGSWKENNYKYRSLIRVGAAGYERQDKPVEIEINFSRLLRRLGESSSIDPQRVALYEQQKGGLTPVPFQFDRDKDFQSRTNAKGTLTFILGGTTLPMQVRCFELYFDGLKSSGTNQSLSVDTPVSIRTMKEHEGQESYCIAAQNATYYYHKFGAGFANLEDRDGNDWLSYNPGLGSKSKSGSGGKYRGTPNMGHPEGYCHPGNDVSDTCILSEGPIKVTLESQSNDGKMRCHWDIFGRYARMTLLKMRLPYWYLYEGTPGGKLDMLTDKCIRVQDQDCIMTGVDEKWQGDIQAGEGAEWLAFADPPLGRSLYIAHHEDDEAIDSYWPMNEEMTVFGFGRLGLDKYMRTVPAHFTAGLIDSLDADQIRAAVNNACQPLYVAVGSVEVREAQ